MGCLVFLALFGAAAFVAAKVGPIYLANKSFESEVRSEVSRAGANFFDDETLTRNILSLARRNEIPITREDIRVERQAGMIRVAVHYSVPLDLAVHRRTLLFDIRVESLIGRL